MRFVIKAVFWFMIVLLFLPEEAIHTSNDTSAAAVDSAVTTSSVKASDVMSRIKRLCSDKPGICESAADALSAIELDTEKGARLALEMLLRAADDEDARSQE